MTTNRMTLLSEPKNDPKNDGKRYEIVVSTIVFYDVFMLINTMTSLSKQKKNHPTHEKTL